MWIDAGSVPWLLSYLADEVATGGVPTQSAVADTPPEPNCATPGLAINMRPVAGNMGTFMAMFVEGPLKGMSMISRVSTFTAENGNNAKPLLLAGSALGPA